MAHYIIHAYDHHPLAPNVLVACAAELSRDSVRASARAFVARHE